MLVRMIVDDVDMGRILLRIATIRTSTLPEFEVRSKRYAGNRLLMTLWRNCLPERWFFLNAVEGRRVPRAAERLDQVDGGDDALAGQLRCEALVREGTRRRLLVQDNERPVRS